MNKVAYIERKNFVKFDDEHYVLYLNEERAEVSTGTAETGEAGETLLGLSVQNTTSTHKLPYWPTATIHRNAQRSWRRLRKTGLPLKRLSTNFLPVNSKTKAYGSQYIRDKKGNDSGVYQTTRCH